MIRFQRSLEVSAPATVLWQFHEQPDVIQTLQPPWERAEVIVPPRSLEVGTRVVVRARVGPLPILVEAEHVAYEKGRRFVDVMTRGPFRSWRHEHRVEELGPGSARLVDDIEYQLPGGALGRLLAGPSVARRLARMFEHRHRVTREWCETVFHLAEPADWAAARAGGGYRAPSLASEGFIHCSTRAQLAPVRAALFPGRDDLVVLAIDAARLDVPLRWEAPAGPAPAAGPFPHVYGPIPLAAVLQARSSAG